jgi:hypothetical protein
VLIYEPKKAVRPGIARRLCKKIELAFYKWETERLLPWEIGDNPDPLTK